MSKEWEEAYREMTDESIRSELPNLWDRIEAQLSDAAQEENAKMTAGKEETPTVSKGFFRVFRNRRSLAAVGMAMAAALCLLIARSALFPQKSAEKGADFAGAPAAEQEYDNDRAGSRTEGRPAGAPEADRPVGAAAEEVVAEAEENFSKMPEADRTETDFAGTGINFVGDDADSLGREELPDAASSMGKPVLPEENMEKEQWDPKEENVGERPLRENQENEGNIQEYRAALCLLDKVLNEGEVTLYRAQVSESEGEALEEGLILLLRVDGNTEWGAAVASKELVLEQSYQMRFCRTDETARTYGISEESVLWDVPEIFAITAVEGRFTQTSEKN